MSRIRARDQMLHDRLRAAHERNLVSIYTDFPRLNQPQSPVFNPWETVLPLLVPLLLAVVVLFMAGIVPGLVVLVGAVLIYAFLLRQWLARQVYERTVVMMMVNPQTLQRVWEFGGVILARADNPRAQVRSPRQDWRVFVERFLPAGEVAESLGGDMAGAMAPEADRRGGRDGGAP